MKAIYKLPGKDPEIIDMENTLEALQEKVGGSIEAVTIATDARLICNENGKILGMPYNVSFCGDNIVGPILIVGVNGEEFCDLPNASFWMDQVKGGY